MINMETFKKMKNKGKMDGGKPNLNNQRKKMAIILISIAVLIIVLIAVFNLGKKSGDNGQGQVVQDNVVATIDGTKTNVSKNVAEDKTVSDLVIKKSALTYKDNTTTLTSEVTNNGADIKNLKFTIKFIADDGTTIFETIGLIDDIVSGQTKTLNTSIVYPDDKIVKCKDVVYEIQGK